MWTGYEPEPALLVTPYLVADFQVTATSHCYLHSLTDYALHFVVAHGTAVRRLRSIVQSLSLLRTDCALVNSRVVALVSSRAAKGIVKRVVGWCPFFPLRISSSSSQLEGVKIPFTKFGESDRINFQEELKTWLCDCTTRSRVAIGARSGCAARSHLRTRVRRESHACAGARSLRTPLVLRNGSHDRRGARVPETRSSSLPSASNARCTPSRSA